MLQIRPVVPPEKRKFRVVYSKLQDFLKDEGVQNCLVVTNPGAYYACLEKLPDEHKCIYVYDAKEETLDDVATLYQKTVEAQKEEAAGGKLNRKYVQTRETLDMDSVETVICLGGGVAVDSGKYIATKFQKKFYNVPTVLSVNAAFCYKAALRVRDPEDGSYNVEYKKMDFPEALCIDFDVILGTGKPEQIKAMLRKLNVAGAGDLLSCITATFDWKINSMAARNLRVKNRKVPHETISLEKPFSQEVCDGAMELMGLLAENIDEIKNGTETGVRFLCEAYHWISEQSVVMNHTMWESASEHGMFDCMENYCGIEFTHGQVVALSVYFMSRLQGNQHERVVQMIQRLDLDITLDNLAIDPKNNEKVTAASLYQTLKGLKAYIENIHYRYTIISARELTEEWILDALDAYYANFPNQRAAAQHNDSAYRKLHYQL